MIVEYEGETYATTAEAKSALGVAEMTLRRAGVSGSFRGKKIKVTTRKPAAKGIRRDLRKCQYTAQEIAARNNTTYSYVMTVAKDIDVRPVAVQGTRFLCLLGYDDGKWVNEEAKRLNVTTGQVLQMLVTDARNE